MNFKKPINVFSEDVADFSQEKKSQSSTLDVTALDVRSSSSKETPETRDGTLYIGEGIEYSGSVLKAQTVIIRGKGEGEIKTEKLEVQVNGTFKGKVEAVDITVAGLLEGELIASASLMVESCGKVQGDLSYQTLSVENGGVMIGNVSQGKKEISGVRTNSINLAAP
jgi:cytoskeletal protein CcmA (bactofilin family)